MKDSRSRLTGWERAQVTGVSRSWLQMLVQNSALVQKWLKFQMLVCNYGKAKIVAWLVVSWEQVLRLKLMMLKQVLPRKTNHFARYVLSIRWAKFLYASQAFGFTLGDCWSYLWVSKAIKTSSLGDLICLSNFLKSWFATSVYVAFLREGIGIWSHQMWVQSCQQHH